MPDPCNAAVGEGAGIMATRVLLAINERLFRESLRDAMSQRLGVEIVGEAGDGREALTQARELARSGEGRRHRGLSLPL